MNDHTNPINFGQLYQDLKIKHINSTYLKDIKNKIIKLIKKNLTPNSDKSCAILITGKHGSGKSWLINEIQNELFFQKTNSINVNLEYIKRNKLLSPLEFFKINILNTESLRNHEITFIDHIEILYFDLRPDLWIEFSKKIIHLIESKSKNIIINKHPSIIVVAIPSKLSPVNLSFNNFGIRVFNLTKKETQKTIFELIKGGNC